MFYGCPSGFFKVTGSRGNPTMAEDHHKNEGQKQPGWRDNQAPQAPQICPVEECETYKNSYAKRSVENAWRILSERPINVLFQKIYIFL